MRRVLEPTQSEPPGPFLDGIYTQLLKFAFFGTLIACMAQRTRCLRL